MRNVTLLDIVVSIFAVCIIVFAVTSFAHDDKDKPKVTTPPKTTMPSVVTQQTAPDYDRKLANAVGAGLAAGFATTALRSEPYGYAYAFGGTVAAAAIIEAAHAGPYQASNVWYAVGGAAVGTVGTCMVYFRKGFVGCAIEF